MLGLGSNTRQYSFMWTTFWPDVLVALVGAVITVAIALATYLCGRHVSGTHALTALVDELHHRRALRVRDTSRLRLAAELDDFKWAGQSVLAMKGDIRVARHANLHSSKASESLAKMTKACNFYLELSHEDPENYRKLLEDLRRALSKCVQELADGRRGVDYVDPGAGAF